jgi:hypothetical protein
MRRILWQLAVLGAVMLLGIGGRCNTNSPLTPIRPLGPDTTFVADTNYYRTTSHSSDARTIRFVFDWGDSSLLDTTAYVQSWDTVSVRRIWHLVGDFEVRARAVDDGGLVSPSWSDPLLVHVHPPHTER